MMTCALQTAVKAKYNTLKIFFLKHAHKKQAVIHSIMDGLPSILLYSFCKYVINIHCNFILFTTEMQGMN